MIYYFAFRLFLFPKASPIFLYSWFLPPYYDSGIIISPLGYMNYPFSFLSPNMGNISSWEDLEFHLIWENEMLPLCVIILQVFLTIFWSRLVVFLLQKRRCSRFGTSMFIPIQGASDCFFFTCVLIFFWDFCSQILILLLRSFFKLSASNHC